MSHLTSEERQRLINSIPEAAVFDAHKENIMPRRQGRSAARLSSFLEMSPSEKEQELKSGHLKYKQQLENMDELDDPLAVYVEYVDWILEHYPQGHTKDSNLLPTLKAAVESFFNDVRYKRHPSYLKLCLEYANWVEDPAAIYRFLVGHDIGQNLALFYEMYAGYLERKTKYDDAKAVFERGLSNNATPKDRLERNYNKMKERIKERNRVSAPRPQRNEQTEALKAAGRTMLGVKYSSGSRLSQPTNVYNNTQSPTQSSSTSIGRDSSNTSACPKDTFTVFRDSSSPASAALPTGAPPRLLNVRSSLTHSENKFTSMSYPGVTVRQAPSTPPPKKFTVYRDHDSPSGTTPSSPTLDGGLGVGDTSESTTTTSIRKQPLSSDVTPKRPKKARENPVSKANQDRFNRYKDKYIKTLDSQSKPELIACFELPPHVSFEEMRARRLKESAALKESATFWDEETSVKEDDELPGEGCLELDDYSIPAPEPTQEITAETRLARDTIFNLCGEDSVPEDEEDVTWTQKFQVFKRRKPTIVDENDYR